MKKTIRRMQLKQETVRALTNAELSEAAGGYAELPPKHQRKESESHLGACCCSVNHCTCNGMCF